MIVLVDRCWHNIMATVRIVYHDTICPLSDIKRRLILSPPIFVSTLQLVMVVVIESREKILMFEHVQVVETGPNLSSNLISLRL